MELREEDVRIDTFTRAVAPKHPGYLCWVRMIHLPTNIEVKVEGNSRIKVAAEARERLMKAVYDSGWFAKNGENID